MKKLLIMLQVLVLALWLFAVEEDDDLGVQSRNKTTPFKNHDVGGRLNSELQPTDCSVCVVLSQMPVPVTSNTNKNVLFSLSACTVRQLKAECSLNHTSEC